MTSCRFVLACLLVLAAPLTAAAGQGDPRLVNGVLEWPRALTNESFVIVRGDDGVLYYVGVASARREGTPAAGARVAVLGIEGRSAHEVTAVGIGIGTTADAALAQLQGARPAPAAASPAAAPPPVAAGPAPIAPPSPAGKRGGVTAGAVARPRPRPWLRAAVTPAAPRPPDRARGAHPGSARHARPTAVAPAPTAVTPAPTAVVPVAPAPAPVATPPAPVAPATPAPVPTGRDERVGVVRRTAHGRQRVAPPPPPRRRRRPPP